MNDVTKRIENIKSYPMSGDLSVANNLLKQFGFRLEKLYCLIWIQTVGH